MTPREATELAALNSMVNAINRVINFGLKRLQQPTIDDLKDLRDRVKSRQQELIKE